ncbi:hypothetical protein GIB67_025898 [Kingdonia uniflora]|uniref:Large ribosomal subunit protein uL15/eL18 domain-containing protein n=1 Tax=Kingdonia uniflora TaxID=39325 RepID=A0A7J7NZ93_9MAGN|nr:hypothetical protein GIB67_025898 [Kingdonia uniflora]
MSGGGGGIGGEEGLSTTKTPTDFFKSIRGRPVVVKLNSGDNYRVYMLQWYQICTVKRIKLEVHKLEDKARGAKLLIGIVHFQEGKIVVIIGTVIDDTRVDEVHLIKVHDLRFTKTASMRIEKAGGECLKFDQLSLRARMEVNHNIP